MKSVGFVVFILILSTITIVVFDDDDGVLDDVEFKTDTLISAKNRIELPNYSVPKVALAPNIIPVKKAEIAVNEFRTPTTRFVDDVISVKSTWEYEDVKAAFPELGDLEKGVGDGETKASFSIEISGLKLIGRFSFLDGKILGYGFSSRGLNKEDALSFHKMLSELMKKKNKAEPKIYNTEEFMGDATIDGEYEIVRWYEPDRRYGVAYSKLYDGYEVGCGGSFVVQR